MAKKKAEEQVVTEEQVVAVNYDDLMTAKVKVIKDGVSAFYIDPARKLGEFVLRPIPQELEEEGEIPEDWRRPSKEEQIAAEKKIDWGTPEPESEPESDRPVDAEVG